VPLLAALGLGLVAIVTVNLLVGGTLSLPGLAGGEPDPSGAAAGVDDPARTAAPSNVVVVPEEATFEGSMTYAKGGNVWVQTDDEVRQLTDSGDASMPSWSPDGEWIYYIHTDRDRGRWPVKGVVEEFILDVPELMRVRSDGSAEPERLLRSRFREGNNYYAYWIRQPVLSPDGRRVALVSDAPDPDQGTVVLQFFNPENERLSKPDLGTVGVLGHQDPEWRPDGRFLLYVRNGREGSRGAPVIMRYNTESRRARALTGLGYLNPSYSPDGRYIAATKTSTLGTNVVILDGRTGQELRRITDDDASWGPTWSPAGDGIAYLNLDGKTVDLRLAKLDGAAPDWTVAETVDLTEVSGLDPASRPDWFIPADRLPQTPPPSEPSAEPAPSASPAS
jgi:Tol biopolymer transport system component